MNHIDTTVNHLDTTTQSQKDQVSHMINVLEKRLESLKYNMPTTSSSLANFVLSREKETKFFKTKLLI